MDKLREAIVALTTMDWYERQRELHLSIQLVQLPILIAMVKLLTWCNLMQCVFPVILISNYIPFHIHP